MGTANITCHLSNLNKFKCYTKSGSKILYEDDGLVAEQTFVIFPNKTILSTGECEYTIGLTGKLDDQNPWKSWSYTVPSTAVPGNDFSYTITGKEIALSFYKGKYVLGVPSKTWSWSINHISIRIHIGVMGYKDYGGNIVFNCYIEDENDKIDNILKNNSITLKYSVIYTNGPAGNYSTRVTSGMTLLSPGIKYVMGKMYYVEGGSSVNPSSGTYDGYNWSASTVTET